MKIHRYLIQPTVELPTGAVFLNAQPGSQGISGWFLCDPEAEPETRTFAIVATGQDLPDAIMDCRHLATMKVIRPTPLGGEKTALHIFDTTGAGAAIPTLQTANQEGKPDPADWWKG